MNAPTTLPATDLVWPKEGFTRVPYRVYQDPAIYALEQELEIERGFQFDNERRLAAPDGQHIATADFGFHGIALRFKKALHGQIEFGFKQNQRSRK